MKEIKHKIRERFETTPENISIKYLDGLDILVGQVRCNINRQLQEIKMCPLDNPGAELKIGNYNEGFNVSTWLDHNKINLRGEYWDRLKFPSNPVLYNAFYDFVNGVREFRKKFGKK